MNWIINLEPEELGVATRHCGSISSLFNGIVATLREVILKGAMQVEWRQMLVLCAFILTLGVLLRYAGIRPEAQE